MEMEQLPAELGITQGRATLNAQAAGVQDAYIKLLHPVRVIFDAEAAVIVASK